MDVAVWVLLGARQSILGYEPAFTAERPVWASFVVISSLAALLNATAAKWRARSPTPSARLPECPAPSPPAADSWT